MKFYPHRQMSESFITAAFLSVSGGLQDAYTYIFRGKVFANAQTGNIVLLGQNLVDRNWRMCVHYAVPLLFFCAWNCCRRVYKTEISEYASSFTGDRSLYCVRFFLLLIVGFLPIKLNLLANAMVSFSCAMQVQAFRKVNGYAFASTMCIGNIRSGTDALCAYFRTKDRNTLFKSLCYWAIILLFGIGAAVGGHFIRIFDMRTIWFSCCLLFVSFLFMFIKEERE